MTDVLGTNNSALKANMKDTLVTRELISRMQSLTREIPDQAIQRQLLSLLDRLAEDFDAALAPMLSKEPTYQRKVKLYLQNGKSQAEAHVIAIRDILNSLVFQEEVEKMRQESAGA